MNEGDTDVGHSGSEQKGKTESTDRANQGRGTGDHRQHMRTGKVGVAAHRSLGQKGKQRLSAKHIMARDREQDWTERAHPMQRGRGRL